MASWKSCREHEKKLDKVFKEKRKKVNERSLIQRQNELIDNQEQVIQPLVTKPIIHFNTIAYQDLESQRTLMKWQGKSDHLIDRYDGRSLLDNLPEFKTSLFPSNVSELVLLYDGEECSVSDINFERYLPIVESERNSYREVDFVLFVQNQLLSFGQKKNTFKTNAKNKMADTGAQIEYIYDNAAITKESPNLDFAVKEKNDDNSRTEFLPNNEEVFAEHGDIGDWEGMKENYNPVKKLCFNEIIDEFYELDRKKERETDSLIENRYGIINYCRRARKYFEALEKEQNRISNIVEETKLALQSSEPHVGLARVQKLWQREEKTRRRDSPRKRRRNDDNSHKRTNSASSDSDSRERDNESSKPKRQLISEFSFNSENDNLSSNTMNSDDEMKIEKDIEKREKQRNSVVAEFQRQIVLNKTTAQLSTAEKMRMKMQLQFKQTIEADKKRTEEEQKRKSLFMNDRNNRSSFGSVRSSSQKADISRKRQSYSRSPQRSHTQK